MEVFAPGPERQLFILRVENKCKQLIFEFFFRGCFTIVGLEKKSSLLYHRAQALFLSTLHRLFKADYSTEKEASLALQRQDIYIPPPCAGNFDSAPTVLKRWLPRG